ncbi:hypothetical protein [Oceanobacillus oncorhynchi]|uniref:hypothetical protein n=1 Tax=Oceanobacillus oncorhynchi TaxID=545501 RepID=UPI0031E328C0
MEDKKENPYITRLEFFHEQNKLENKITDKIKEGDKDISMRLREVDSEVSEIDKKVDDLRDILLPLAEFSKQTAENTKNTSDAINSFTNEQRKTNSKLWQKANEHDVALAKHGKNSRASWENWKTTVALISAILSVVGIIIGGIFALAPMLFQ